MYRCENSGAAPAQVTIPVQLTTASSLELTGRYQVSHHTHSTSLSQGTGPTGLIWSLSATSFPSFLPPEASVWALNPEARVTALSSRCSPSQVSDCSRALGGSLKPFYADDIWVQHPGTALHPPGTPPQRGAPAPAHRLFAFTFGPFAIIKQFV